MGLRQFTNGPVSFAAVFTLACHLAKLLQLQQDFALLRVKTTTIFLRNHV
jgi:hypothetical protein